MNKIVLFAASKDQLNFFDSLAKELPELISLWWYKKITLPIITAIPFTDISSQVSILQARKKNSSKGKLQPNWFWSFFRVVKKLEAYWLFLLYAGFLSRSEATFVGVWNGKKFRQAILVLAANKLNKPVLYFETGPLPGYSVVDPVGVDFYSALPRSKQFYQQYNCLEKGVMQLTADPLGVSLTAKYIFVPFQVVEDSNIYLHSPWLPDMRHFFAEIESLSIIFPELNFVIKKHPSCPESYVDLQEKALKSAGKIQFVENVCSKSLVVNAQAVMTINSTVGMEAIMARKKIIVLGEAIFGFAGLTKPVSNRLELEHAFRYLAEWQLDEDLINRYLCFLQQEYAIKGDAMRDFSIESLQEMTKKIQLMLAGQSKLAIGLKD